jgi:HTH DNA binding domain
MVGLDVAGMRRVVMELSEKGMEKLGGFTLELSGGVESLEVSHRLSHGTEGSAILCRIKPKDPKAKVADLKFKFKKFEVLSEGDAGFIVYLEAEAPRLPPLGPNPPKVFLNLPIEVRGGRRRVTILGEGAELKKLFRWLGNRSVDFKVLSNSDAKSSPESALGSLSGQQRKALLAAYSSGYYEIPRRSHLEEIARGQRVNKSTFAEHLLKAENRLIARVLADELNGRTPEGGEA